MLSWVAAGVKVLFGLEGASMRVARRRIDVSDGVMAPHFFAISAACAPGKDGLLGEAGLRRALLRLEKAPGAAQAP